MPQAASEIRIPEMASGGTWPVRTQAVSFVGSACVVQGADDFDLDDLNLVRHQFPGRRVTLDGDVITVWPTSPHGGQGKQHPVAPNAAEVGHRKNRQHKVSFLRTGR
ncbi:hypothetical protein [Streptomyces avermitilis]|uniref:hypothetical protein n=1 Tax=Streptomyces avermitilis TaxID=33903 RepID=UPI00382C6A07